MGCEELLNNGAGRLVLEFGIMLGIDHPLTQVGKLDQFSEFFGCKFRVYHWAILAEVEGYGEH